MPRHAHASHRIVVDAPVDQAFMFFTPAGEELWAEGWQPSYIHPSDGRTEAGMVFTTGKLEGKPVATLLGGSPGRVLPCSAASRIARASAQ